MGQAVKNHIPNLNKQQIMVKMFAATIAVGLLVMSGCQSDKDNDKLLDAIMQKDVETVRKILAAGNIDLEPRSGLHDVNKPLAYAAAYGNLEIVKMLVEAGADLNGQVAYGDVPLIKADEHDNDDIIEYLIKKGADVNFPNYYGVTPFFGLCAYGNLELVKLALEHGADINSSYDSQMSDHFGIDNFSPFQAAVNYNQPEVVAFLLSHGGDPRAKDFKGRTPIELAESKGHDEIAQLLRKELESANDN